ncbi:hypothetical protein JXQ70_17520 [bacterium]|nr:hypothetical protein [bacterium]
MKSHKVDKSQKELLPGFRGRYEHTIDPKGRLALPSRFRKVFENHYTSADIYLTTYDNESLVIYPLEVWIRLEESWTPFTPYDEDVDEALFFTSYNGLESNVDGAGRFLIPKLFREETGLNGDVTIIGKVNHFEVWDRERARERFQSILSKKNPRMRLAEIGAKINRMGSRSGEQES